MKQANSLSQKNFKITTLSKSTKATSIKSTASPRIPKKRRSASKPLKKLPFKLNSVPSFSNNFLKPPTQNLKELPSGSRNPCRSITELLPGSKKSGLQCFRIVPRGKSGRKFSIAKFLKKNKVTKTRGKSISLWDRFEPKSVQSGISERRNKPKKRKVIKFNFTPKVVKNKGARNYWKKFLQKKKSESVQDESDCSDDEDSGFTAFNKYCDLMDKKMMIKSQSKI